MRNITVIEGGSLNSYHEKRYIIVDKDTGEMLDDAQGYEYKSPQKAYAAYYYRHRTPEQK